MNNIRQQKRRGSSVIEFAIGFTLVWALFAGVFQFGYTSYVYNGLMSSVANGGRFASRVAFDAPTQNFVTQIKNVVVYGSPSGGTATLVPGLTTSNVNVTWTTDSAGVPDTISVSVQNFTVDAVFTSFTFTNKPSVTMKYAGVYKPA